VAFANFVKTINSNQLSLVLLCMMNQFMF